MPRKEFRPPSIPSLVEVVIPVSSDFDPETVPLLSRYYSNKSVKAPRLKPSSRRTYTNLENPSSSKPLPSALGPPAPLSGPLPGSETGSVAVEPKTAEPVGVEPDRVTVEPAVGETAKVAAQESEAATMSVQPVATAPPMVAKPVAKEPPSLEPESGSEPAAQSTAPEPVAAPELVTATAPASAPVSASAPEPAPGTASKPEPRTASTIAFVDSVSPPPPPTRKSPPLPSPPCASQLQTQISAPPDDHLIRGPQPVQSLESNSVSATTPHTATSELPSVEGKSTPTSSFLPSLSATQSGETLEPKLPISQLQGDSDSTPGAKIMTPAQYQNDDVGGTISNDCSPSSGVEADKPIAKPTSDSVATSLKIAPDAAIAVGRVEPREEGRGSLVDTCSAEKVDQTLNAGQAPEAMDSAEKEMSKSAAELQGAQTSSQPTGIEVEGQAALDMPSSSLPISASQDTVATDGRKADSYCSPGEEQEQNVEDTANAKRPSLMPMESNKEVTEKEFIATQGARVGNRACDMETAEDRTAVVAPAQVSAGSQSEASKVVIPANATTEPDSPSQRGVPALKSLQAASGIHANKNNTSPDRSTAAEGHGEERQEGGPYAKVPEEGRKEEPKAVDPQKRIEGNGGNRDVQRVRGEGHTYEIQVMGMDKESDETRASEAGTTNSRLIATLGEGQKVTIGSQNAKENNSEESSATQKSDIAKGQAEKHHVVDPVWSEQPEARGLDQTTTGQKVPQGDGGNVPMDVEVGPAHVVRSSSVVSMDISPTATPQPDANGPVESERDPPVNLREVTMNRVKALIEPNEGVVESLIRKLNLASRIRQIQNKDFIIGSVVVSAKQLSMLANVNPVMISTELDDFLKAEENGQSWEMTPKVRAVVNLLYRIFVLGKFPCTGQGTLSPWVTGESGQPPAIKILTKSKVEEVSPSLTQASSSQGPVAKKKKAVKPAQVIGWENIYTKSSKVPGSSKQGVGKRAVRETSSVQSGETSSNHLKAGSLKNALGSGGSQPGPVQSSSSSKKRKAASPEPESSPSELTADDAVRKRARFSSTQPALNVFDRLVARYVSKGVTLFDAVQHFLERRVSKLDPNDSDRIKVAELIQLRLNTMQELGQAIKIRLSKKLRDEVKSLAKAWHREKETVVKASSPQVSLAVESERPNDKAAIKSTSPANLEAGPTVAPSENEKQQSEPVNFENERSKEKRPLLAKISAPGCSLAHAIELSDDSDNDRTQDRPFKPPGATVTQDIYKRPIPAHPIGGSAPVADTESRAPLHQQSRTIKQLLAMETLPRLLHTRSKDFEGSTGKELLRQVTSYEQVPDLMAKFSFMDLWNVVMSQPTVCEQIEKITHWQKGVGDGFFSEEAGGGGGGSDL